MTLAIRTGIPPAYWLEHPADMTTAVAVITEQDAPEDDPDDPTT